MKEHPYVLQGLVDLPASLQQAAGQWLKPDDPAKLILMIPRHTQTLLKNRRYVPQQALLFTSQGVLHVQEKTSPDQPPLATYLRSADLLYAHHSLILLYGCLELGGEVSGHLARIVVEYNTVGQQLLQPALQQFLRLAYGPAHAVEPHADLTNALLQNLAAQSLKFQSGLQFYALQPGEPLLGFVFQPRIVQRNWHLFSHPIAPATLLALTDREVILIEEERARGASYGWLITFCPRRCIAGIETMPKGEWQELCVHLARNNVTMDRRVTLENDTALAWETLWSGQSQREK
jgi:hypothetical protein